MQECVIICIVNTSCVFWHERTIRPDRSRQCLRCGYVFFSDKQTEDEGKGMVNKSMLFFFFPLASALSQYHV